MGFVCLYRELERRERHLVPRRDNLREEGIGRMKTEAASSRSAQVTFKSMSKAKSVITVGRKESFGDSGVNFFIYYLFSEKHETCFIDYDYPHIFAISK